MGEGWHKNHRSGGELEWAFRTTNQRFASRCTVPGAGMKVDYFFEL
jgi:hypothetical protein